MKIRKMTVLAMTLTLLASLVVAVVGAPTASATNGVKIQMCIAVDGSGSIDAGEWALITGGLSAAVTNSVPDDGSVELSVVQFFGSSAQVELGPTVITAANKAATAATLGSMVKGSGYTPMAAGIDLAVTTISGSPNYDASLRQIINITTDGNPEPVDPQEALAIAAAANAMAVVDEIHAEGIGSGVDLNFLLNNIVRPQPGMLVNPASPVWPPTDANGYMLNGFVIEVTTFDGYADAIDQKFQTIIDPTPTIPGAATWSVLALIGALGITSVIVLRRRYATVEA